MTLSIIQRPGLTLRHASAETEQERIACDLLSLYASLIPFSENYNEN